MLPNMEAKSVSGSCYCCMQPPARVIDLDSALHELGMISDVTESRRQYLRERTDRARAKSESDKEFSASSQKQQQQTATTAEPDNCGYQILQMDTKYFVGMSSPHTLSSLSSEISPFSTRNKYNSDSPFAAMLTVSDQLPVVDPKMQRYRVSGDSRMEMDEVSTLPNYQLSKVSSFQTENYQKEYRKPSIPRLSRLSRAKRSLLAKKKPYELPKSRLCRSMEVNEASTSVTPGRTGPGTKLGISAVFHRSKSLDDLDVAKLQLSDTKHHQEIDSVSEHLRDLHVNDQVLSSTAV